MLTPALTPICGTNCLALCRVALRLLVASGLVAALPTRATSLNVQVLDGGGKPLAGAAVFLESREAKLAARPVNTLEIVQSARQFLQPVTLVTVGSDHLRTWHPGLAPGASALDQPVLITASGGTQARVRVAGLAP